MLKYFKENINGKIVVRIDQIAYPPTVYLDTWAFCNFLTDKTLSRDFINILNKLNGTLCFSIISLIEIVNRKDQKQIKDISIFIDSVEGAFIDFNIYRVIKKEKIFKNEKMFFKISPCADIELLDWIANSHKSKGPPKVSEVILAYQKDLKSGKIIRENWEKSLFPIIERARNNANSLSNAKKRFRRQKEKANTCKFPCTEFLMETCIDYIVINENMKMPDKEWRDIFHTIVPVAYCDFVLVDKKWLNFIKLTGLEYPQIAKVYTQRNLSEFLKDLENWKRPYKNK